MLDGSAKLAESTELKDATRLAQAVAAPAELDVKAEAEDNKPLFDNVKPLDLYNESGSGNESGDQRQRKAIFEQAVPGDWNIGGNGGGALYRETEEEKKAKKEEELQDFIERVQEEYKEQERQEEAARKWDAEMHLIGGQQFTGQQLHESGEWFKKPENIKAFEERIQQQGATETEAKKRADKIKQFDALMEKMRTNTATVDERKQYETIASDPQLGEDLKKREELKVELGRQSKLDSAKTNVAEVQSERNVLSQRDPSTQGFTSAAGPIDTINPKVDLTSTFNAEAPKLKPMTQEPLTLAKEENYSRVAAAKSMEMVI